MQANLYSYNFGDLQDLTNTGEVAVAFNGSTRPINGTFFWKLFLKRTLSDSVQGCRRFTV